MAVAGGFSERVKHLFCRTALTGGTRGGAALCKQPLMAEPLSGLCTPVCVGDWACVFPSPRLPALVHQVFISNATRLLNPPHVSFPSSTRIFSVCTSCFHYSQCLSVFTPPFFLSTLSPTPIPPRFLLSPPSLHLPPPSSALRGD